MLLKLEKETRVKFNPGLSANRPSIRTTGPRLNFSGSHAAGMLFTKRNENWAWSQIKPELKRIFFYFDTN